MGGSGTGQPNSPSPSISQKEGAKGRQTNKSGRPHNLHGFDKARATGTLANDLRMGRMGVGYMHNPAFRPGAEKQTNRPKQLPSQHIATHGDDDPTIRRRRTTPTSARNPGVDMTVARDDAGEERDELVEALKAHSRRGRK